MSHERETIHGFGPMTVQQPSTVLLKDFPSFWPLFSLMDSSNDFSDASETTAASIRGEKTGNICEQNGA